MVEENIAANTKIFKMVPPDGGWGYMIFIAYIINMMPCNIFVGIFGIIYDDYIIQLHMDSTSVTLLNGISMMSFSLAGFFTSSFLKLVSVRMLGFFASFVFNFGLIGTLFVKTKAVFFVTQLLQYIGMGLLYNLSFTVVNAYFLKKRLLVVSAGAFMSASAGLVAPLLVEWTLEYFGFKGTIFILAGITMHTFVACAVLQPVSWHMVKVEVDETVDGNDEMKFLLNKNITNDQEATPTIIAITNTNKTFETKIDVKEIDTILPKGNEYSKSNIKDYLDVPMLKKFFTSNASMAPAFCMFSDLTFLIMLPQILYSNNWSKDLVAKAVALTVLGDLITRVLYACFSKWLKKFGNQELFLVSVILAFVSRLSMHCTNNVILVLIFITLIGVARCSTMILPPLILADVFGPEKFTKVLGIFMLFVGTMNLVFTPCIGAIRDLTHSYASAFYVVTACYAAIIIMWSIELKYKKNNHKGIQQQPASAEDLKSLNVKITGK